MQMPSTAQPVACCMKWVHLSRGSGMLSSLAPSSSCSRAIATWCSVSPWSCSSLAGSSSACLLCLARDSNRCFPGKLWASEDLKGLQNACDRLCCLHSMDSIVACVEGWQRQTGCVVYHSGLSKDWSCTATRGAAHANSGPVMRDRGETCVGDYPKRT